MTDSDFHRAQVIDFHSFGLIAFDERYLATDVNAVGLKLLATNQIASVTIRFTHLLILFTFQFKTNYFQIFKKTFRERRKKKRFIGFPVFDLHFFEPRDVCN